MSVYVSSAQIERESRLWYHLIADDIEELHSFALKIGLKERRFLNKSTPQYRIIWSEKRKAIKNGAIELDRKQFTDKKKEIRMIIRIKETLDKEEHFRRHYVGNPNP